MKGLKSVKFASMFVCALTFFLIISSSVSLSAAYGEVDTSKELDIIEVLKNPKKYEGVEVIKHTVEEYKQVILNDSNLSNDAKTQMLDEVNANIKSRAAYDYWTVYDVCKVNSAYTCRPYFYTYASFNSTGYPLSFVKVQRGSIDRNYNGVSKQFSGELYYHLERNNKLHWDLNGDFFNNGTTTVSLGASVGVGGDSSISFSISSASNHFAYCHKYDDITF